MDAEELLGMVQWFVNSRERLPETLVRDLAEAGVAVVTMDGAQQRIDIAPEYDALWTRLVAEGDAALTDNEFELQMERLPTTNGN